jgi:Tfp pilus assembly protein PilV
MTREATNSQAPSASVKRFLTQDTGGFSLIEAMIAMVILTVGLLSIAQLVLVSLDKSEFAEYDVKAINVAQGKIEELRGLFGQQVESGVADADLSEGSHGPVTVSLQTSDGRIQGQLDFQVSWQVQNLAGGRRQVAVSVSPAVQNPRRSETITFTTYFSP